MRGSASSASAASRVTVWMVRPWEGKEVTRKGRGGGAGGVKEGMCKVCSGLGRGRRRALVSVEPS